MEECREREDTVTVSKWRRKSRAGSGEKEKRRVRKKDEVNK